MQSIKLNHVNQIIFIIVQSPGLGSPKGFSSIS